jgi:hypothetical protein
MLTKSDIASFRQCPRRLWLEKHAPHAVDPGSKSTSRRARDGAFVGQMARDALGPEIVWPPSQPSPELSAQRALDLLKASPGKAGVEIPLLRDELSARADAIIPEQNGYVLQETKSSTFPLKKDRLTPDEPDEHLLDDIAIQIWVMSGTGLPLERAELNLLDNRWRYPGGGDYRGLFRQLIVGPEIGARVAEVPNWLAAANSTLAGSMPATSTGSHCDKPYPCPFHGHCRALDPPRPEHPIELLPGLAGKNLAKKLNQSKGYVSLLEPAPEELVGNSAPLFRRIQQAHRMGAAVLEANSGDSFSSMPWPRYYFDFEGIDLPVPRWAGVRPYEHIPFQWSCHIERSPGVFKHEEFLDLSGDDPSLPCIDAMLKAIPPKDNGPIFVYFKTYEKGRMEELGERHPEYADAMNRLIDRLVDLFPLVRDNYYHEAMRGSFSIKKVLPTIAKELDYGELGGISDGSAASTMYISAALDPNISVEQKQRYRDDLLRYCKQDTWALVEVAHHLQRLKRPSAPR